MVSQPDVNKLIQQTRQYEFADGLRDLQLAILLGTSSATVWLILEPVWITFVAHMVQVYGRWATWINLLPVFAATLAVVGMLPLMNFLRRRWLWRESGMVKPRWVVTPRINVLSVVILVGGVAAGMGARYLGWADEAFTLRMFWVATSWSFGYTLVAVGRHIDMTRYVWLGAAGGLTSTIMLFLRLDFRQSALMYGLSWSLLLAASGIIALRRAILSVKESQ